MPHKASHYFVKETTATWDLVNNFSEQQLNLPIRDDNASAREILAHMTIASRSLLHLAQASYQAFYDGQPPPHDPDFDLDRWNVAELQKWRDTSLTDIRRHWQETVTRLERFAQSLKPEDVTIPVHFVTGEMITLLELLNMMSFHLREHRLEIQNGLAEK